LTCAVVPSEAKRVLIADDTASSRELLRSILEAGDYLVAEARDGKEVLEMVPMFGPHLVILDLQMPKLDGYATVLALRRMPALQRTPIIALTAAITQTVPEKISEAGFTAYLVKPIGPAKLRQCVAKLLQEA
jgi:CheY-like chemotaxis protein